MAEVNYYQQLKSSVLFQLFKQENAEPQNYAIEGLSQESARITRAWQYTRDIERVKNEMNLALAFVSKLPSDDFLETYGVKPEDYILYHYGYFLDLIHQLKDKIGHLCDSLTTAGAYVERDKLKTSYLVGKKEIKNMTGLSEELEKWSQEADNPVGWALKKRTTHHHFRSKLTSNSSLSDVSLYRTFQINFDSETKFTEYGKKVISERGMTGLKNWQKEVEENIKKTIKFAEEGLEKISKILCENCDMPKIYEGAEIIDNHFKMIDSLKIQNLCRREKISAEFEPIVEIAEKAIPQSLNGHLASLYITGSIPRGEAIPGYSNLNMVVVIKSGNDLIAQEMKSLIERFTSRLEILDMTFDMIVLTEEQFMSDKNKKTRFICKKDGLLLAGNDLTKDEKFPKPGLQLAFLLNSDVRDKISDYLKLIAENSDLPQSKINKMAYDVSRIGLWVIFSGIIAERAIFERNLSKIKQIIDERFPENAHLSQTLYDVATRKSHIDLNSLQVLLENGFGEGGIFSKMLKKIEEEHAKLGKRKKI